MRLRFFTVLAATLVAGFIPACTPTQVRANDAPVSVRVSSAPLDTGDPTVRTVGRLRYVGGVELTSNDKRFGGYSALEISADGTRLTALSDTGTRLDATLDVDAAGEITAVTFPKITPLTAPDGRVLKSKEESDAEGMAILRDGRTAVAFERDHRVWVYDANGTVTPLPTPPGLEDAPDNGGLEALVTLGNGRLLALQEDHQAGTPDGTTRAWVYDGQKWETLTVGRAEPLSPTGAARLPDGGIIMAERNFTPLAGVRVRVSVLDEAAVKPGAVVPTQEIARLQLPLTVDNFEGIAARKDGRGRTLIYLISDDNFNPLQRTLLMIFELLPPKN